MKSNPDPTGALKSPNTEGLTAADSSFFGREIEDVLASRGITPLQAARLLLELTESAGGSRTRGNALVRRCRDVISLGCDAHRAARASVCFARAVESSLAERGERRPRTLREIRNICARLLRSVEGLALRRVRSISAQDCRSMLVHAFHTTRQRAKARVILHGIFAHSLRQGWCDFNPVSALPSPRMVETEVAPLAWNSLKKLVQCCRRAEHRPCMPALGLMLWAGVRPAEVERLCWQDLDWEELVICVRPRHSKTGGARHITLQPVLSAWLREFGVLAEGSICPPDWSRRWKKLRTAAGVLPWQQDVLRHNVCQLFPETMAQLREAAGGNGAPLRPALAHPLFEHEWGNALPSRAVLENRGPVARFLNKKNARKLNFKLAKSRNLWLTVRAHSVAAVAQW